MTTTIEVKDARKQVEKQGYQLVGSVRCSERYGDHMHVILAKNDTQWVCWMFNEQCGGLYWGYYHRHEWGNDPDTYNGAFESFQTRIKNNVCGMYDHALIKS